MYLQIQHLKWITTRADNRQFYAGKVRHAIHESVALKLLHLLFHQLFRKRKIKVIQKGGGGEEKGMLFSQ